VQDGQGLMVALGRKLGPVTHHRLP
jgi:hypothetical protein